MAKKIRLTVDVSQDLHKMLDDIANDTGSTKTEVFRRAIALLDVSHKAHKRGEKVGIAREEQALKTEFLNL